MKLPHACLLVPIAVTAGCLSSRHEEPGRRSLFDGQTLDGWTTRGGRYDGDAAWTVEDGLLVGRTGANGEGGLIYTESLYSAFELEFDVWLDYPYDSGLFTNMLPPESGLKGLQVTLDHRPGGEIAGIYADGWLEHNPDGEGLFRRDAWNHVRVRQTGFDPHLQVWINGQAALDFQLDPDAEGFARHGRIGLQVHPADASAASRAVRFRALELRELSVLGEALADGDGWVDLLAEGLAGFEPRGSGEGYAVQDGVLSIPTDGGGELATRADYRDFELSVDYRLASGANSGLYMRSAR
ncbi:MAG: family 16 glycoside hydrolase, partial [Planctomycetota bacterium]